MATVTANSTKGVGGGKATLEYICRDDKTDNKKYVTALNCSLPTVYQEFKNTREMYAYCNPSYLALTYQSLCLTFSPSCAIIK